MKVAIYLETASSPLKQKVLECFGRGIERNSNDVVIYVKHKKLVRADVAVILGFYGNFNLAKNDSTHEFRRKIYQHQINSNKNIIFIDRDLFCDIGKKVTDQLDPHHFFRVSMGSIYFNEGIHFNHIRIPNRWEHVKKLKDINDNVEKISDDNILICLNNGEFGKSWATKNIMVMPWAIKTAKEIRKYSNRKIVIRFHPKTKIDVQKKLPINLFDEINDVYFSGGILNKDSRVLSDRTLDEDFRNAYTSVFLTSSAAIVPALYGNPIITSNAGCPAYAVANHSISDIQDLKVYDKTEWLDSLANCIWSSQDMLNGTAWTKISSCLTPNGDISKKAFRDYPDEYNKYLKYYYSKF